MTVAPLGPRGPFNDWLARRGAPLAAITGGAMASAALAVALLSFSTRAGAAAPAVLLGLALAPVLVAAVIAYPTLALIVVFATFPIGSIDLPGGLFKIVQASALAMAALVVLRRLASGRTPLPWSPPLAWAAALLVWTLVGLGSALDTQLALKQIGALLGGIVFALVLLGACTSMADLRRILLVFVVIAGGTAAYALGNAGDLRASFGGAIVEGRLTGTFVHPNELGSFCAMGALVAAGLALGGRNRRETILASVALGILLTGLTLSFARGAWIGLALGLAFLVAVLREARRAALVIGVPLILVAWLIGSFSTTGKTQIEVVNERLGALTTTSPYDNRRAIWREALREIREDPMTGQGAGSFPVASVRSTSTVSTVYAEHAHDMLLTWGAESGLPAAILIVGFAVALAAVGRQAARAAVAAGRRRDRALVAGISAALLSVLGQGLVDYTLRNAVIFVTVWALVGALLVCRRELVAAAQRLAAETV